MTTPTNTPPVAIVGDNLTAFVGESVRLSGALSMDADDDTLSASWALRDKPADSTIALEDADDFVYVFVPDAVGDYTFILTVDDGQDTASAPLYVRVFEGVPNEAPIAEAGKDLEVVLGEDIELDGRNSRDPEGDPLTFSWVLVTAPESSMADIANPTLEETTLTPDVIGQYVFELVVNDGRASSAPDMVTFDVVEQANRPPIASAGPDVVAIANMELVLDGTGSTDPDGDPLEYRWMITAFPPGANPSISENETATPTFLTDLGGAYEVEVVINDGIAVASDRARITVMDENTGKPVANAGPDRAARVGRALMLDGTGSMDPDMDPLTYRWIIERRPAGSSALFDNALIAQPTLTPDVEGVYEFSLTVSDGIFDSDKDFITITVGPDAAPCLIISEYVEGSSFNKALELYNCGTNPIDLTNFGICQEFEGQSMCGDTYTGMTGVLQPGDVYVVCNDRIDDMSACDQTTNAIKFNGNDRVVLFEDLDADMAFDPVADDITDQFGELGRDPGDVFANRTLRRCAFTPYAGIGPFDVGSLYTEWPEDDVSDLGVAPTMGCSGMPTNRAPVANTGSSQRVMPGAMVTLDGSGSTDADMDPLTYTWTLTMQPATSMLMPTSWTTASFMFTPTVEGTYVFELVVNDGAVDSAAATVDVVVSSTPPPTTCLVISELVEDGNTKGAELYNCGSSAIDLTRVSVCTNNTGTACAGTQLGALPGGASLMPGDVVVVCRNSTSNALDTAGKCDQSINSNALNFNGDDAFVVFEDTDASGTLDLAQDTVFDAFAQPFVTQPSSKLWEDAVYRRCVQTPYDASSAWMVTSYFTEFMKDDYSDFGVAPTATSCP